MAVLALAAVAVIVLGVARRDWAVVTLGAAILLTAAGSAPPNRERAGASARHGKQYHLLSVRTWTGIRTLDLTRLRYVQQRSQVLRVLDAEGVTVRVTSAYAREAIKVGVERWGVGEAEPNAAARRTLARWSIWALIRQPRRARRDGPLP